MAVRLEDETERLDLISLELLQMQVSWERVGERLHVVGVIDGEREVSVPDVFPNPCGTDEKSPTFRARECGGSSISQKPLGTARERKVHQLVRVDERPFREDL